MLINLFHNSQLKDVEVDEDILKNLPSSSPLLVNTECMGVIGKIVSEGGNITAIIGDEYEHFYENFTNYKISKIKNSSEDSDGVIFVLT